MGCWFLGSRLVGMENGCAGWGCLPNRKLAVFGQFLVGGGGSKGESSSERFPAEIARHDYWVILMSCRTNVKSACSKIRVNVLRWHCGVIVSHGLRPELTLVFQDRHDFWVILMSCWTNVKSACSKTRVNILCWYCGVIVSHGLRSELTSSAWHCGVIASHNLTSASTSSAWHCGVICRPCA